MGHRPRLTASHASASALASVGAPKTYWRLTDTIHACVAHGRPLLLDVANDRYFSLPAEDEPAFAGWLRSPGDALPRHCLDSVLALRVADGAALDAMRPVARTVTMPVALDADRLAPVPVSPALLSGVTRSLVPAWRAIRGRRLRHALKRASRSLSGDRASTFELGHRLAQFRAARPLIPIPRICLQDCLALVDWLGPGLGVELVIGVSPYPFSAHCWVQAGGRLIDDHPQSPSRFDPILHLS